MSMFLSIVEASFINLKLLNGPLFSCKWARVFFVQRSKVGQDGTLGIRPCFILPHPIYDRVWWFWLMPWVMTEKIPWTMTNYIQDSKYYKSSIFACIFEVVLLFDFWSLFKYEQQNDLFQLPPRVFHIAPSNAEKS